MTGLVLSGGGARSAYQVGALKALIEITSEMGIENPFPILSGTSAGALNASYLAAHLDDLPSAAKNLENLWGNLTSDKVFKVDLLSVLKSSFRLLVELSTANLSGEKKTQALLDTTPLRNLIEKEYKGSAIEQSIKSGKLRGLAVKALSYSTGVSTTFFQGSSEINPWEHELRKGKRTRITIDHILASSALPILFPPVKLGSQFYGDGSIRNNTPLSPVIKMGADRVMVVSVRSNPAWEQPKNITPSPARILGVLLNTLLLDAVEMDFERLVSINDTLKFIPPTTKTHLKPVQVCLLSPSRDIGELAVQEFHKMPRTIRYMLRGLGTTTESADLISYLIFEPSFMKRVIELGYHDTLSKQTEIRTFYS